MKTKFTFLTMLFAAAILGYCGLQSSGISVVTNDELACTLGADYEQDSILKSQVCVESPPSGTDGCTTTIVQIGTQTLVFCNGSCAEVCVGDGIRKWCACSSGNTCDNGDEQVCEGGELYKDAGGFWGGCYAIPFLNTCSDCDYNLSGSC